MQSAMNEKWWTITGHIAEIKWWPRQHCWTKHVFWRQILQMNTHTCAHTHQTLFFYGYLIQYTKPYDFQFLLFLYDSEFLWNSHMTHMQIANGGSVTFHKWLSLANKFVLTSETCQSGNCLVTNRSLWIWLPFVLAITFKMKLRICVTTPCYTILGFTQSVMFTNLASMMGYTRTFYRKS